MVKKMENSGLEIVAELTPPLKGVNSDIVENIVYCKFSIQLHYCM